jgi:hypothetical protein
MRILRTVFGCLVLASGCGRSSEATPLSEAPVAPAAVEPAAVTPALETVPDGKAPIEAKPGVVPAALTQKTASANAAPPPKDTGGKLLDQFLQPADGALPLFVTRPRPLPAAPFLERPTLKLPPFQGKAPRLKVMSSGRPPRPHPVAEGMPLYSQRLTPRPPVDIQLAAAAPLKWPSPNTDDVPALPTLAVQQPDRAPLSDPTGEASASAALQPVTAARTSAAPFVRLNLPDPFEHRDTVRLRTPPPEDPMPAR